MNDRIKKVPMFVTPDGVPYASAEEAEREMYKTDLMDCLKDFLDVIPAEKIADAILDRFTVSEKPHWNNADTIGATVDKRA